MFLIKTSTKKKKKKKKKLYITFDPLVLIHNNFAQMFRIKTSTKNKTLHVIVIPRVVRLYVEIFHEL